jgi:hypothetical protein
MQARLATAGAPLARLGDWLIPLGLAVFGLYETLGKAPPERGAKLLQTLGVLAVAVPLLWRRRAPLVVLAVVVVGFAVAWPAERSTGGVTFTAVFGLLIAVFWVGAYAERARAVPVVAVAAAMVVAMLAADVRAGYLRPADAAGSWCSLRLASTPASWCASATSARWPWRRKRPRWSANGTNGRGRRSPRSGPGWPGSSMMCSPTA